MSPAEVKALDPAAVPALADTVRRRIIDVASRNGGHLASSLGAVELSIALLRVFNPPEDSILWDVGHQSYAWKILTGRDDRFATLRQHHGLAPFPNPAESPCDAVVSGHAGVAFAAAEGIAKAHELSGRDGHVVAVIGDASITNGCNLEALNNCATLNKKLILVLNANNMSISRNVGAMARLFGTLLSSRRYNRMKTGAENVGRRLRLHFLSDAYHRVEHAIKSLWLKESFFESFGLRYIGTIDGNNAAAVERALKAAKTYDRPVVVHVVTRKGKGFAPAEQHPDEWHGVGAFDAANPSPPPRKHDWSAAFGDAVTDLAGRDRAVCALTAAMKDGTGLSGFSREFPDRFFDVGICEEHLLTFAAGLATGGMKPVVAIYSTFLQRAIDQVAHDICISSLPVVIAIDRAGLVGADGKTHNGMFDIPLLRTLPSISILQPRNAEELSLMLNAATERRAPVAIRYPRGNPPGNQPAPAPLEWGKAEPLSAPDAPVQIWALGDMVPRAFEVAELLAKDGVSAGVVNARFVKPLDRELLQQHRDAGKTIVTLENGALAGGFGSAVRECLNSKILSFGWPDEFIAHGTARELEVEYRLDAKSIAASILTAMD